MRKLRERFWQNSLFKFLCVHWLKNNSFYRLLYLSYLLYLSIHEKANCVAMFYTVCPHSLESCCCGVRTQKYDLGMCNGVVGRGEEQELLPNWDMYALICDEMITTSKKSNFTFLPNLLFRLRALDCKHQKKLWIISFLDLAMALSWS